jgi:hypothetical protein
MNGVFWVLYGLSLASVVAFGIGMYCLLRPTRILAVYRWTWSRSMQLARQPALLDETETRYVGAMFLLGAVILAGSTFVYG